MLEILQFFATNPWIAIGLAVFAYMVLDLFVRHTAEVIKRQSIERSRRELAAYVAEGSIKPEQAATLLSINQTISNDPGRKLAAKVADETVSPESAQKLAEARKRANDDQWREMVELVIEGMPADTAIEMALGAGAEARAR